jgi:holo-[acyl-carrier protein] synthase
MNMVGVGLDLIDLPRFEALYGGDDPDLLARCFTVQEIADAGDGQDRLARLAGRFAAKEAVLKLIGGLREGMALTDIEVVRAAEGAPDVALTGLAQSCANQLGIARIHLSVTHSATAAAAVAIGMSDGPAI